jgi:hypothetical protein
VVGARLRFGPAPVRRQHQSRCRIGPGASPADVRDLARFRARVNDQHQKRVGEDPDQATVIRFWNQRTGTSPVTRLVESTTRCSLAPSGHGPQTALGSRRLNCASDPRGPCAAQ